MHLKIEIEYERKMNKVVRAHTKEEQQKKYGNAKCQIKKLKNSVCEGQALDIRTTEEKNEELEKVFEYAKIKKINHLLRKLKQIYINCNKQLNEQTDNSQYISYKYAR